MATHKHQDVISVEEYFMLERASVDMRYEYIDGYVYALAGGTVAHSLICGNVYRAIGNHLEDSMCCIFLLNMRVCISDRRYVYPDVSVSCDMRDRKNGTILSPNFVVEVLSPDSASFDRGVKSPCYRECPAIEEYMLIDSRRRAIEVYRRAAPNLWTLHLYGGGDVVELASLQLSIPLESIYEDIVLAEPVEDEF